TRQLIQSSESVGENIAQRVRGLVNMLLVIHQAAIFQVQKAQNRQKQLHDRKIQNITEFGIGKKVFDWNVVKLRTMEGQVVSTPISTSLIKKDITSLVPSGVLVTPPPFVVLPPFAETHDLVESVDTTHTALLRAIRLKNKIETLV
ncbi:27521_t:CDS:2, partial [Dentiscutata erythropus]